MMPPRVLQMRPCPGKAFVGAKQFQFAQRSRHEVAPRAMAVEDEVDAVAAEAEEPDFEDSYEISTLSIDQVQDLLKTVSEETSIAEVHLKLADLEVKFRRSAGNAAVHVAQPAALQSFDMAAPAHAPAATPTLESVDDSSIDVDESVVAVHSPKVGIFRTHKYVKGKKMSRDPMVKVGDTVKQGQTIAFIEQLGTHWPVEASMAGEVVAIHLEEGAPVEYDEDVFELLPLMASAGSRITS